jgi:hypothetical protein
MKSKIFTFVLMLATLFVACEKDGDLITVSNLESNNLVTSQSEVVLEKDKATEIALTLTWSKKALIISDTSMAIPSSIPSMILEISANEAFTTTTEATSSSFSLSYTSLELNTIAKNLGLEAFKSSPLYFRIKARLGNNTTPVYSNVATVSVTPYSIDMSVGFILDKDKAETGVTLYSANSDGEYKGFMGATAWYNFFLLEGDGTTWGNYGADGYVFVMDNNASSTPMWNFWFPGLNGCYYTTLSTSTKKWSANLISSLSITGEVTAEMTFTRPDVTWMASFTTTTANASFTINGISALYNSTTGTDDASAIPGTVTFAPGSSNEVLFNQTGTFTVPGAAGDYTLKINLSDPKAWTYEITAGAIVVVDPISKYLYLPGVDDGISGSWTFNNYLNLISEDDSTFAGVVNVNSLWGYQMGLEADNWTDVYKMASGDAYAGTLSFKEGSNISAPDAGLYLIQADLKNKTYSLTSVEKAYVTGLNDDWTLAEMTATETVGVYSSQITISKASSWGFQVFIDDQWKNKFGGAKGILSYNGANITDDATIAPGTYTLIVNFIKGTYLIVGEQIYVTGLNDKWDFTSAVLPKTAPGVYSGQVTISAATPWGYNFLLYDGNWDAKFGGSESALTFGGANIVANWYATMGTYTMSVDFISGKCTVN